MPSLLNQTKMSLKERLALHVGFSVSLHTKGYSSEPGILQKVGAQFMKVEGQFFNPLIMHHISLLGFVPNVVGEPAQLRTTTRGSFSTRLVRTGADFVELIDIKNTSMKEWILIPMNKVISIEKG